MKIGNHTLRARAFMRPLVAVLLVAPLLAGCGGSDNTTLNTVGPLNTSAQMPDGLTAMLSEAQSQINTGGTVVYTVSLVNNTAAPISYRPLLGAGNEVPGNVPASLRITDVNGNLVYPRNAASGLGDLGGTVTLQPGQSTASSVTVGGTDAGRFSAAEQYDAVATFSVATSATDNTIVTKSVGTLILQAQ